MEEGAGMGRGEMRDKEEERKALVEVRDDAHFFFSNTCLWVYGWVD